MQNLNLMYRFIVLLCSTLMVKTTSAQSKWSYGIQFNQSESTSPLLDICITRMSGGDCFDLQGSWQTNFYLLTNYQPTKRLRMQSGLGLNRLHFDGINQFIDQDKFNYNYLSIPLKAHYFLSSGRLGVYLGAGLRFDLRLNETKAVDMSDGVYDNSANTGLSFESLLGLQYQVNDKISVQLEPTYSLAVSNYRANRNMVSLSMPNWPVFNERPERIGISLGLTFAPNN